MCVYRLVGSRRRGATRIEINRASSSSSPLRATTAEADRRSENGAENLFHGAPTRQTRLVSSQRIISWLAKYSRRGCKPQPPLEIAGIRGAVPLTFELHEYSRPNDHREGPYVHARSCTLAFFAVFFSLSLSLPLLSLPYRVHASISSTGSLWDQSWNFQSSMVQASDAINRDKIDQGVTKKRCGYRRPPFYLFLLAIFISTLYRFPPLLFLSSI